jgi:dATP pyrophosphohydrolase
MKLESFSTIPAKHFGFVWGEDTLVIPERVYAVSAKEKIKTSSEHQEFIWLSYEEAISILEYDSNKNALWELDYKLKNNIK